MNGSSGGDEGRGDLERASQRWQDETITALKEVSMPHRARGCCDWLERKPRRCGSTWRKAWVVESWIHERDQVWGAAKGNPVGFQWPEINSGI